MSVVGVYKYVTSFFIEEPSLKTFFSHGRALKSIQISKYYFLPIANPVWIDFLQIYTENFFFKLDSFLVCKGENPMFEDAEMRTKAEKI